MFICFNTLHIVCQCSARLISRSTCLCLLMVGYFSGGCSCEMFLRMPKGAPPGTMASVTQNTRRRFDVGAERRKNNGVLWIVGEHGINRAGRWRESMRRFGIMGAFMMTATGFHNRAEGGTGCQCRSRPLMPGGNRYGIVL